MERERGELAPFVLDNVQELGPANEAGRGAYGVVCEVTVDGVVCMAKRLHSVLMKQDSARRKGLIQSRFHQECVMLSKLKHPNIVHFVGVHYGKGRELVMVMEKLNCDLAEILEHHTSEQTTIPFSIKLSILLDIAYGLLYLHTQSPRPIIHRDLTARNVLLANDLHAKIADLGVSKLVNVNQEQADTLAPGNVFYMPPEALKEPPKYEIPLDIFSFGHLTIYVATQKPPSVEELTTVEILACGGSTSLQVLRRRRSLDEMGDGHCLYPLVLQCLQDYPQHRPATSKLTSTLKGLCIKHPKTAEDILECCYQVSTSVSFRTFSKGG